MSPPSIGMGHLGSTRNEWLKTELQSEQVRAGVVTGCEIRLSTPAMEIWEGGVGPENSGRAE